MHAGWRRLRHGIVSTLLAILFQSASPAAASDIRPLDGVHEAYTLLAQRCRDDAAGQPPSDCTGRFRQLPYWTGRRADSSYDPLQIAVRWPDDPLRQIRSGLGVLRFGRSMTSTCERLVATGERYDELGLLCSSHFGPLQFFHAMAASRAEATEQTRARILDWADLLFRIATGAIRPEANLCDHFRSEPSDLAAAFAVADPARCMPGRLQEWTFTTLLTQECDDPRRTENCALVADDPGLLARTARGALLHMIQDSYSQSHAVRGPPSTPFRARVVCRLPTAFYSYLGQEGHARADSTPALDESCAPGGEADDPITASAMALYHLDRRSGPAEFNCYLQARVFGTRALWANPNPAARYTCRRGNRG